MPTTGILQLTHNLNKDKENAIAFFNEEIGDRTHYINLNYHKLLNHHYLL
ncbi:MAG: hypothetical protein QNJ37_19865 [Crocosphaera sp.]|nr:hypothetical protein [Crocosphaera sp.]